MMMDRYDAETVPWWMGGGGVHVDWQSGGTLWNRGSLLACMMSEMDVFPFHLISCLVLDQ